MDQSGLKLNGNKDDGLKFGAIGPEACRDTSGTPGLLLQSAMHLPSPGALPPSSKGAQNGGGGTKEQGELGGLFESSQQHLVCEGSDAKEVQMMRMQKQEQDIDVFSMGDHLSLLNQSISILDQTSTSVINTSEAPILGSLPLSDLFSQHIKQEGSFSLEKDLGTYSGQTSAVPSDLDGNSSRLIDDSEIWQDLHLTSSLPEISALELDSEVAHLDNILKEGIGAVGFPKEANSLMVSGENCGSVNGAEQQHHPVHQQQLPPQHLAQHQQNQFQHQQPPSILSSVVIKEEKDPDFIHIRTPGVVKQEKQDSGSYCQTQCLQSGMSSFHGAATGGSMSSPLGVGSGPGYHYTANLPSTVGLQDQKPFGLYSNLPQVGDRWMGGKRYGESSGIPSGNDGLPSTSALPNFPVSYSRYVLRYYSTPLCLLLSLWQI